MNLAFFFANLLQVHARIEDRLKELERASAAVSTAGQSAAALETIHAVLDFFSSVGSRHQDDEELTLFSRLRSLPAFTQILSALEVQHRMNDDEYAKLSTCVRRFSPSNEGELRGLACRFAEMQRGHMIAEERALFPLAARTLSCEVIAEMEREMRERPSR